MDQPTERPNLILPSSEPIIVTGLEREDPGAVISREQLELLEMIRASPLYFFTEILEEKLDDQQVEVLEAVRLHRRVAVKSGHS